MQVAESHGLQERTLAAPLAPAVTPAPALASVVAGGVTPAALPAQTPSSSYTTPTVPRDMRTQGMKFSTQFCAQLSGGEAIGGR